VDKTLASILERYRPQAIAEATFVTRQNAHGWRTGATLPSVDVLPRLAEFLEMPLDELTRLVASA
jgi:transcriptional regulator with XRE-family HTH domain